MDCRPNNDYSPAFGDCSYRYARRPKTLQQILQEIQECADKPLTQGTTLPPEAYTSEAFYHWEMENIFRNEWICLAHISQISSPGDFLNVEPFTQRPVADLWELNKWIGQRQKARFKELYE